MHWLCHYSIRRPRRVCVVAAAITLALAPGVTRLTLRTDGHALVPADAPEIKADAAVRARFGVRDPIVVVIESDHDRGVYNLDTLSRIRDLTEALQRLDGVESWRVTSLATEKSDRVYPGTLRFRALLDPFPETDRDLDRIRDDVRAIRLYTGTVVSADEQAAAIFVGVPDEVDRVECYGDVREIVAGCDMGEDRVQTIGAPVAEALLGTHILEDLGVPDAILGHAPERDSQETMSHRSGGWDAVRATIVRRVGLVPVAIAIIAVVFWITFRSAAAVVLPLSEVGVCLMLVFACMGWCGVPIYLTTAVLPVILTVIGIADEIHIFHRYRETLHREPAADHGDVVRRTMDEMWGPVMKTSVTTAVGFLSFALSPIAPVRAFGLFTALGILFCMLWSLTVIPAMLVLIPPTRFRPSASATPTTNDRLRSTPFARCGGVMTRHRVAVIVVAFFVVAAAPFGVRRLVVQDSWIDGFAPNSPFGRAMRTFNERFLGMHTLWICVDGGTDARAGTLTADDLDHHQITLSDPGITNPQVLVGQHLRLRPDDPDVGGAAADTAVGPADQRGRTPREWSAAIEAVTPDGDGWIITFSRRAGSPKLACRQWGGGRIRYRITPRRFMQPEFLRRVQDFEAFLRAQTGSEVGGALGPAAYLTTAGFMEQARRPGSRAIPDGIDRVQRLWRNYGRIRGEERLRQVVDADYARGLVSVFLKNANYVDTRRLMKRIRKYEDDELRPHGVTLAFSGDVAVSQALIRGVVTTQIRSLLISLGGILLVTALLTRSLALGLLCVLPCAFAVLVNFAVMGWLGVPLGVATSMFAGMTLGIGIDYAIHLVERLRYAQNRNLTNPDAWSAPDAAAVIDAVSATGPAITIDALAVALGFGVMTLSQVPANARLGGLLILSIAGCLATTLLLLPVLLDIVARRIQPRPSTTTSGVSRSFNPPAT